MVTSTIPTILTPRVAAAHANGNKEEVQKAIGESIVISAMIGIVVTAALWFLQMPALMALGNRNALRFSVPYLRSNPNPDSYPSPNPNPNLNPNLNLNPDSNPNPNLNPNPNPNPKPSPGAVPALTATGHRARLKP